MNETDLGKDYLSKRVDYEKASDLFFSDNGVAYIACRVSGIDDVVSHYSVPGVELLSEEFSSHLESLVEHVPSKRPLVLELTGHRFSDEEKNAIEKAVANYYRLRLGNFQYYRKKEIVRIAWFVIYILIFCLLVHFEVLTGLVNELAFLIFYSVGDRLIQGAWLDKSGVIEEKMFLGQLMSMKVVFTEEYSPESLSDEESHELTEEIIEKAEIRNN